MRHNTSNRNQTGRHSRNCLWPKISITVYRINSSFHCIQSCNIQFQNRLWRNANQCDFSCAFDQSACLKCRNSVSCTFINLICSTAWKCFRKFLYTFSFTVKYSCCTHFHSFFQTFVHYICNINLTDTSCLKTHNRAKTNASASQNNCSLSHLCIRQFCCMHSNCQRLDQCPFQRIHIIRKLIAHACIMHTVFCIYSVSFSRNCKHLDILTEIIISFSAIFTFSAGYCWFNRNFISYFKSFYPFANSTYYTSRFMSQSQRTIQSPVS